MGQGGTLTLVNGTNRAWRRTKQQSYQMNSWSFPETIAPWSVQRVYVEWDEYIFHSKTDDAGEVDYTIDDMEGAAFSIQARASSGFQLNAVLTNVATEHNAQGAILPLGWAHDGDVQFILTGQPGAFVTNDPPTAWMQSNLGLLGSRPLRGLCMPGAHDAGMSIFSGGTIGASACNVVTQSRGLAGQLETGARYFDIRPVIAGGAYVAGHYSDTGRPLGWQGGNGQSIDSMIADINAFLSQNKELVILNISHDLNTDVGEPDYRALNQDEWTALLSKLTGLENRFNADADADLSTRPLGDFIGDAAAAVVLIVRPSGSGISLGEYAGQGFFTGNAFPVFDSYSGTNDLNVMITDQLQKMQAHKNGADAPPFLLSWTLTQSATQAVTCVTGISSSIIDLARSANPRIYSDLVPHCTDQCFPNILYIDDMSNQNIVALAMSINALVTES